MSDYDPAPMSMLDVGSMPARIEAWLATAVGQGRVVDYTIMTGGFSRVMAKVDIEWADGRSETLVLRGDPPRELATLDSDRTAEWRLLAALSEIEELPTPRAHWFVDDESLFGTKAVFMEYLPGGSLQATLDGGADHDDVRSRLVDLMSAVSTVEPHQLPETMASPVDWQAHMDAVIGRWEAVARGHVESLPIVRYIAAWLRQRLPDPVPLRLVHGDFQQGNIVCHPDGWRVVDWEFARIGDPREDLGYYNAYASAVPPNLAASDLDGFLRRFRERTGLTEEQVNPVTFGYFTVLSTITSIEGLYHGIADYTAGHRRGVAAAYNVQLVPVGSSQFVAAIDGLEAALAAAEEA